MSESEDVLEALLGCSTILISVHKNPDGDALGSQIALMLALERLGKTVSMHNLDPVPELYRFLPHVDRITTGAAVRGSYDGIVVLDADPPRTGLFDAGPPGGVKINIDHHITNPRPWQLTWLDPRASATGEMIFTLISKMGVPLDRDIALCLYTAIFTDTGSFRYTNTSPESMQMASALLEAGVDPWYVAERIYETTSFRRLKLLGHVLAGMERSADGRIAWIVITDDLYRLTGTSSEDTEHFVNYVRSVKGVEVAILFRQTGGQQYKLSLRSKGRASLASLAQTLGGGGHDNAAGSVMEGSFEVIRQKVIGAVEQLLRDQGVPPASPSR